MEQLTECGICGQYHPEGFEGDCRDDANRYPTDDLMDEFTENGLSDVAEYLQAHGAAATRGWIDSVIADARENDDPEGWRLGNLEVARDRLANA